jgi:2-iminobutanoate/2-iminopropanoate deaminase
MPKEVIIPKNVFDSRKDLFYSQAVKAGNTVYVSGQVSVDEAGHLVARGDFEGQVRQSLENIKRILEAAGAGVTDIVKLNMYLKDERYLKRKGFYQVLRDFFGDWIPTNTAVQIVGLYGTDLLIEIEAIAVID